MFNKIKRNLKNFLLSIDQFGSFNLLRYKDSTSYTTLTGGTISLLIFITFGAIMVQQSIAVFNGVISAVDSTFYVEDPTYSSFRFDDSSKFMLGVGIVGLNLSDSSQYFNITMSMQEYSYGALIS